MSASSTTVFDYDSLSFDKAASALAAAERIRARISSAFIETGRDLIEQKRALGHGNFLRWIEAEFNMSERSAQNLISIAGLIDSNPQHAADLSRLSARALTALAAPSTPESVREEVIERASRGEKVTAKEIDARKGCAERKVEKGASGDTVHLLAIGGEEQNELDRLASVVREREAEIEALKAKLARGDTPEEMRRYLAMIDAYDALTPEDKARFLREVLVTYGTPA